VFVLLQNDRPAHQPNDVYDRWLGAAMEPIERVFIAMVVIGLAGFLTTIAWMLAP
jgi:hypothetical protein